MPTYDYYSEETGEVKEVFHGMNEEPEVLDSEGNQMRRIISGGTGFTIQGGGTRKRTFMDRYGHKKTENLPTPSESAQAKAAQIKSDSENTKKSHKDPYYNFRD